MREREGKMRMLRICQSVAFIDFVTNAMYCNVMWTDSVFFARFSGNALA